MGNISMGILYHKLTSTPNIFLSTKNSPMECLHKQLNCIFLSILESLLYDDMAEFLIYQNLNLMIAGLAHSNMFVFSVSDWLVVMNTHFLHYYSLHQVFFKHLCRGEQRVYLTAGFDLSLILSLAGYILN